jgi:ankyrin repeat protein
MTPLHYAVHRSDPNETIVRLLVDAGADISAPTTFYEIILTVIMFGHTSIMQLLLRRGPISTIREKDGFTLLHCATELGTPAMIRLILEAGVNTEASNCLGETALHLAVKYDRKDIVQALLQSGANVAAIDYAGFTLLHCAAGNRTPATVQLLLDAGVNIEATNYFGETALHLAVKYDSENIVEVLLQSGANTEAIDNAGRTPLQTFFQWTIRYSAAHRVMHRATRPDICRCECCIACVPVCRFVDFDEPVVDQLLSAGANIWASSNFTRSPLDTATLWMSGW